MTDTHVTVVTLKSTINQGTPDLGTLSDIAVPF